jgi:hypothetical protein
MSFVSLSPEYQNAKYEVAKMYSLKNGKVDGLLLVTFLREDAQEMQRRHRFPNSPLTELNGEQCSFITEATPTRFNDDLAPIPPYVVTSG